MTLTFRFLVNYFPESNSNCYSGAVEVMPGENFSYFVSFHVGITCCLSVSMSEVKVHQRLQHVLFIRPQKDVDPACQGIKLSASLSLCLFSFLSSVFCSRNEILGNETLMLFYESAEVTVKLQD